MVLAFKIFAIQFPCSLECSSWSKKELHRIYLCHCLCDHQLELIKTSISCSVQSSFNRFKCFQTSILPRVKIYLNFFWSHAYNSDPYYTYAKCIIFHPRVFCIMWNHLSLDGKPFLFVINRYLNLSSLAILFPLTIHHF